MPRCLHFVIIFVTSCLAAGRREPLSLVVTETHLPKALIDHEAVYDGLDSIYILGGYGSTFIEQVLRYSLASGAIEYVAPFPRRYVGSAVMSSEGGNVVYFGGTGTGGPFSDIHSFSTRTNTYSVVNNLPDTPYAMGCAWDSTQNIAYTFGGLGSNESTKRVFRYNARNNVVDEMARLPEKMYYLEAVWSNQRQVAYIFGEGVGGAGIYKFVPAANMTTKLPSALPGSVNFPFCAVIVDEEVYILSSSTFKFSTGAEEAVQLQVDSWPNHLSHMACTYVPKLQRIYIFGGAGSDDKLLDQISYIQLNVGHRSNETHKNEFN